MTEIPGSLLSTPRSMDFYSLMLSKFSTLHMDNVAVCFLSVSRHPKNMDLSCSIPA